MNSQGLESNSLSNSTRMSESVVIGIDATNLRGGGGRTHLIELLNVAKPESYGISRIVVWGSRETLGLLANRSWLEKLNPHEQEGGLVTRMLWQKFSLARAANDSGCDVLFVPGGSYSGSFHPIVTMSRNMLPFEKKEMGRYGLSLLFIRLLLLRFTQLRTLRTSDGVIFLTSYAKKIIQKSAGILNNTVIIPHGLNDRFVIPPRAQTPIEEYSSDEPYKILYVSIIDQYKHQWHVVDAISRLRNATGWNLELELVGPVYIPSLRRLQKSIQEHDPDRKWVKFHGSIPFEKLHTIYQQADLGLFASSCENMPNILLETMASGLPVASSNRGPMPEILGDAGLYFDPEDPGDIASVVEKLITSPQLRTTLSHASFDVSKKFTWDRCADETFSFLADVHRIHRENSELCAG